MAFSPFHSHFFDRMEGLQKRSKFRWFSCFRYLLCSLYFSSIVICHSDGKELLISEQLNATNNSEIVTVYNGSIPEIGNNPNSELYTADEFTITKNSSTFTLKHHDGHSLNNVTQNTTPWTIREADKFTKTKNSPTITIIEHHDGNNLSNVTHNTTPWTRRESDALPDVDQEPYLMSQIYQNILKNIPRLARNDGTMIFKLRSCRNRCGISNECSCRPFCTFFKTCCIDFQEACGGVFDSALYEEKYQWLNSVETQCISQGIVIDSCTQNTNQSRDNDNDVIKRLSNDISSRFSKTYFNGESTSYIGIDQTVKLSLEELAFLILSTSHEETLYQTNLQHILSSTPVLDSSTGMSYRNVSVYMCNGAQISQAIYWTINVPMTIAPYPISGAITVKELFHFINRTRTGEDLHYMPFYADSIEQCIPEAVQLCSNNTHDADIINACQDYNYFISVNSVAYKNPFCLYCNTLSDYGNKGLRIKRVSSDILNYHVPPKYFFRIEFGLFQDFHSFSVKRLRRTSEGLAPSWAKLSCEFFPSANKTLKETTTNASKSYENIELLTSECRINLCSYFWTQSGTMCQRRYVIGLALPPPRYKLGKNQLAALRASWKQLLLR